MPRLTGPRLVRLLQQAGFKGDRLRQAYAIVMRESGGNPSAHNTNRATGDDSYGLFQVNMLGGLGPARRKQYGLTSDAQLLDALTNAKAAFRLSQGGADFGPWGVGPNAYRKTPPLDLSGFPGGVTEDAPTAQAALPAAAGATRSGGGGLAAGLLEYARSGGQTDLLGLLSTLSRPQQPKATVPNGAAPAQTGPLADAGAGGGGLRELFYDPLGAYDEGQWIKPIGGHRDHVHLSFGDPRTALATIQQALTMGLRASENPYLDKVDPVHTKGSYHYRRFPGRYKGRRLGRGLDVSGRPDLMAALFEWAKRRYT